MTEKELKEELSKLSDKELAEEMKRPQVSDVWCPLKG